LLGVGSQNGRASLAGYVGQQKKQNDSQQTAYVGDAQGDSRSGARALPGLVSWLHILSLADEAQTGTDCRLNVKDGMKQCDVFHYCIWV
jgi:hypothetical protein